MKLRLPKNSVKAKKFGEKLINQSNIMRKGFIYFLMEGKSEKQTKFIKICFLPKTRKAQGSMTVDISELIKK